MKVATVLVKKDGEEIRVNKSDVDKWTDDGFKVVKGSASKGDEKPKDAPKPDAKDEEGGDGGDAGDVPEIKASMTKAKIAEALDHPGYAAIKDSIDLSESKAKIVKAVKKALKG